MYREFVVPLCWCVFLVVAPLAVWGVFALVERRRQRTRDGDHFRQLRRAAGHCARARSAKHNGHRVYGQLRRLSQPSPRRADAAEDVQVPENPHGEIRPSSSIPQDL